MKVHVSVDVDEYELTIMSSIAQQESVSLSKNVRIGVQYRFQQGQVYVNYNRFLGYTKNEEGKLVIVPEEAEVVKRIFREYLAGGTTTSIAAGLDWNGMGFSTAPRTRNGMEPTLSRS